jgi:tetratricopeptide (TPR) repeat protein
VSYIDKIVQSMVGCWLLPCVAWFSVAQPQPVQSQTDKPARIAIPGVAGALEVNVGTPSWLVDFGDRGREVHLSALDRADHLLITTFLQEVNFLASPERCRKEWWPLTKQGTPTRRENLDEITIKDGIARVEYIIPRVGSDRNQKTIHAYLGGRNLCAEIHLSKVEFKQEEQKLFEDVLATARFLPDEPIPPEPNTMHYVFDADHAYMHRDFKKAAQLYQKALDLEGQNRTLTRATFRMVVLGLGTAHFLAGDMNAVKGAADQGIAEDPEYPLFYYLKARACAKMGRLNESLEQLRLAYKHKDNMAPGDPFPNPLLDDAFRRFANVPEFVQAVHELQRN